MRTFITAVVFALSASVLSAAFAPADAKECTSTTKSGTRAVVVKCK